MMPHETHYFNFSFVKVTDYEAMCKILSLQQDQSFVPRFSLRHLKYRSTDKHCKSVEFSKKKWRNWLGRQKDSRLFRNCDAVKMSGLSGWDLEGAYNDGIPFANKVFFLLTFHDLETRHVISSKMFNYVTFRLEQTFTAVIVVSVLEKKAKLYWM